MKEKIKIIISVIIAILFVYGLYIIFNADRGIFGTSSLATIAGSILSIFSGIWISIVLYSFFKKSNDK